MNKNPLIDTLRAVHFFHGLSDDFLEKVATLAELIAFDEGDLLFREGETAEFIYLVVEGNVSLEICAPGIGCRQILTVGDGELLAWSTLLEQTQLTANARAVSPTQAVRIPGGLLLNLCNENPDLGLDLMRRTAHALAKRLSATRLQLLNVYGEQLPEGIK